MGLAKIRKSFIERFVSRLGELVDSGEYNLWWENVLYSYGRYSMTTYQHIRKFRNLMGMEKGIVPWNIQEVNLELVNYFK